MESHDIGNTPSFAPCFLPPWSVLPSGPPSPLPSRYSTHIASFQGTRPLQSQEGKTVKKNLAENFSKIRLKSVD